jgi:hypothetical protein
MPNNLASNPLTVTTDLASFGAAQTLQAKPFGIRVWKIALVAAATTTPGTVMITNPVDGSAHPGGDGPRGWHLHSQRQRPAALAVERF